MSEVLSRIEKPWGYEELIEHNAHYVVKRLFMKQGNQCSYQYHEQKHETVIVLSGTLQVIMEDQTIALAPGEHLVLVPGVKHRMRAESTDCLYLECSTPHLDDVIRISDDYGRTS